MSAPTAGSAKLKAVILPVHDGLSVAVKPKVDSGWSCSHGFWSFSARNFNPTAMAMLDDAQQLIAVDGAVVLQALSCADGDLENLESIAACRLTTTNTLDCLGSALDGLWTR